MWPILLSCLAFKTLSLRYHSIVLWTLYKMVLLVESQNCGQGSENLNNAYIHQKHAFFTHIWLNFVITIRLFAKENYTVRISIKNWLNLCILQNVLTTFVFMWKNSLYSPSGIDQKINSTKTPFLLFTYALFWALVAF